MTLLNDSLREATAGALAGAVTKTVAAPLDRLKLVVQLRSSLYYHKQQQYSTPWHALRHMVHTEGFWALWRGNVSTILINCGTAALNFMFMDWYKKVAMYLLVGSSSTTEYQFSVALGSGFLAGGTAITVLYPIGLARTKLALDVGKTERLYPRGMRDVLGHSLAVNGVRGLYKGYGVALASVSLYRMVHLGGYDYGKTQLLLRHPHVQQISELPWMERFVLAQAVSMLASTIHYPLDSVRRRLAMQSDRKHAQYRNAWHCWVQIYQQEGLTGYFRGLGTNYVRSISAAFLLVSYDFFKGLLS